MLFVTVGTHEQQFNRLIKAIDELVAADVLTEQVFIQSGYCTYIPEYCKWRKFISATEMSECMRKASVVVTHGGPSSFIEAMGAGKVPVVVPRRAEYGEHVNDHQVDFVHAVAERQGGIVPCYEISELPNAIDSARHMAGGLLTSHNAEFCKNLKAMLERL